MKKFTVDCFNPYLTIFEDKKRQKVIKIWIPKKYWEVLDNMWFSESEKNYDNAYIGTKLSFGVCSGIEIENISKAEDFFKTKPKTHLYSIHLKILSFKQKNLNNITQKEAEEFDIPIKKFKSNSLKNLRYFIKKNYSDCNENEEGFIIKCRNYDKKKDAPSDYEKAVFSQLDKEF